MSSMKAASIKAGLSVLSLLTVFSIGETSLLRLRLEVAPAAIAQTTDPRQAEADRLLQQGIQQGETSQFAAAIQSWQQALTLYQQVKDRQGEGNALGNLGIAYYSLGNYTKALSTGQKLAKDE